MQTPFARGAAALLWIKKNPGEGGRLQREGENGKEDKGRSVGRLVLQPFENGTWW